MAPRRTCLKPAAFLLTLSLLIALTSAAGHGCCNRPPWLETFRRRSLLPVDIINLDSNDTSEFSADYGNIIKAAPSAVLHPSSPADIAELVRSAYNAPQPFKIAARGHGHSVRGQALAPGGVVVDMAALGDGGANDRINVRAAPDANSPPYVDAGGEQLWIDVLRETLKSGLAPRSWTDFLHLTVGGTLSNAGIGGQTYRFGPQIANVYELDVVTGKGEIMTCSREINSDLFYGALGGLGQFGVITRARIALERAPQRVRWLRLFYTDFGNFTRDQELLISMPAGGFDYVEGQALLGQKGVDNSSFFSSADVEKVAALAAQFDGLYMLEGGVYYDSSSSVDEKLEVLLKQLSFVPGLNFSNDVSYTDFLARVPELPDDGTLHPWLNLFLPKSRVRDFQIGVFKGIIKDTDPAALVLLYPMNKNKWDEGMSAAIPNEEVFYTVGLLRFATAENWKFLDGQNDEILRFCEEAGIEMKQYLPHYTTQEDWKKHFGDKWDRFAELKRKFDPKVLLSPGQHIFA
ncbi:cytokinin dehydrogenase 6 [Canna indica]|uniref:cytokinin dehydrogenase n=1 Tax=Canna indica TaxID=4628 RepID=A0AAQ3QI40_9LILI|nr:cytokinin dehydrogenase 6 [Canna indica]